MSKQSPSLHLPTSPFTHLLAGSARIEPGLDWLLFLLARLALQVFLQPRVLQKGSPTVQTTAQVLTGVQPGVTLETARFGETLAALGARVRLDTTMGAHVLVKVGLVGEHLTKGAQSGMMGLHANWTPEERWINMH